MREKDLYSIKTLIQYTHIFMAGIGIFSKGKVGCYVLNYFSAVQIYIHILYSVQYVLLYIYTV